MISKEFRTHLLNQETTLGTKIYTGHIPAEVELPAALYLPTSTEYGQHLEGGDGLAVTNMRVEIVAADLTEAETIAQEIRLSLVNYSGTWGSYNIGYASIDGETVEIMQDAEADTYLFVLAQDWKIGHSVPV